MSDIRQAVSQDRLAEFIQDFNSQWPSGKEEASDQREAVYSSRASRKRISFEGTESL
jgi:hypothetical protein